MVAESVATNFLNGQITTQTGHTNMNLGFSEPDIRGELKILASYHLADTLYDRGFLFES